MINSRQNLGQIYRLIEQFELISRRDLAKLSGYAPASITAFTRSLIENQFILEQTIYYSTNRGRPSIGLAVSPHYWKLLSVIISSESVDILLCELNGTVLAKQNITISSEDYSTLEVKLTEALSLFYFSQQLTLSALLAISISVRGKLSYDKKRIIKLGNYLLDCHLAQALTARFSCTIFINEHFHLWLLAESHMGSLINDDNVLFFQFDDVINLSVLMKGKLLEQNQYLRMNVDKMMMPRFSHFSDRVALKQNVLSRYQLRHQITQQAMLNLIDYAFPNQLTSAEAKFSLLEQQLNAYHPKALLILEHLANNLAYVLMNLINIFSSKKIMLVLPLIKARKQLFERILFKLKHNLLQGNRHIDLVTGHYEWNNPSIPCAAIKEGIYQGNLIRSIIDM